MDKIIIEGGSKLSGSVEISGSKNAALPILISTLLTDEKCVIRNVPQLKDIETTILLLEYFGKKIVKDNFGKIIITRNKRRKVPKEAPYDLVKRMRASFWVAGPLMARYGKIKIALPGGCAIGIRPIDIHLSGFEKMGANIEVKEGFVHLDRRQLKGAVINFRFPSVGATENIILAATLAKGKTVIKNAAREPEIIDLANFLNKLGAKIENAGQKTITITGVKKLGGTLNHSVIPDRIEAGTYLIAGAITRGEVKVNKCIPEHIDALLKKLRLAGFKLEQNSNSVKISHICKIKPVNIITSPYPGFPTDLQAQWMALMCVAQGKSEIKEEVFENRFIHAAELQRLGAKLSIKDNIVTVLGNSCLSGAPVMVSDLRAGAALVLAGLAAKGKTTVNRIYHLDRGYENLEKKLVQLGANIYRKIS
ncbi:MAG: UDP-N-acetylglucosamine 1-carboxyvinyltransferase [Elusimicrobia bacterium]|nr:UDP-N-acetylglucosamine 1-carboxyvinyltransferase [Elusimicrobiota bacterium]